MTLAFAGFPARTYRLLAGDGAIVVTLATIRAECDRNGRCCKSQRYLARKGGIPLSTVNWAIGRAVALGILTVIPNQSRRKPATLIFGAEHLVNGGGP